MTSVNRMLPAEDLSPRQERIAHWLRKQVGLGAEAFFLDACGMLYATPQLHTVTHLVAHALREVESAVRAVLEPVNVQAGDSKGRHRTKIVATLVDLGIARDDAVAEFWLALSGPEPGSLPSRAHRPGLNPPRPADNEFLDFVDRFEQVLDAVMDRFEARYLQVFERLDTLLAEPVPSRAAARMLRQRFPHTTVVSTYFFSRASAGWLGPLRDEGFFTAPPQPEVDAESGMLMVPGWPESEYLARIAADAPEEVVATALAIPATENNRVQHDLIEIGLAVPTPLAARLVPAVIEAAKGRFGLLVPHQAGALVVHLGTGGQVDDAMTLARVLLGQVPERGSSSTSDAYEYALILRDHVPALVDTAGTAALAMLCELLADGIRRDRVHGNAEATASDGSHRWRPNIDGQEHRAESDALHALTNAVRDAATAIGDADPSSLAEVVSVFDSQPLPLFRRLAMHLLAQNDERGCDLVVTRLTDRNVVQDRHLDHEYLLMAHRRAACLDTNHLRRLLVLIDEGPRPRASDRPVPQDRAECWRRDRLAAIQAVLPPDQDARYQALVAEYGEAPDPASPAPEPYVIWSRDEEGPISADELAAMPTGELIDFLKTWQPPSEPWPQLSPASLRGALSSAVRREANRWSADAAALVGLPPAYISAALNGLWEAAKDGSDLNWEPIISLAELVNQRVEERSELETADGADRDWRDLRMDLLRLLMSGLNAQPNPVAPNLDARLWSIIESWSGDPQPTPQDEAGQEQQQDGFVQLAHTTLRPHAIRAAIAYGWRLHRRSPDAPLDQVLTLLRRHLAPEVDPSRAVRSVYGEHFPQLVSMAPEWAAGHVDSIFPLESEQQPLMDTAWDGYLGAPLTAEASALLVPVYSAMVDRTDCASLNEAEQFRTSAIGHHLVGQLWWGQITVDSHGGLLRRYFDRAPTHDAHDLLDTIGRNLTSTENAPDPALVTRLMALWEFRVTAVRAGAPAGELAGFGRWFASGQFAPEWSLQQLLTTLTHAQQIENEAAVLNRLTVLAPAHTQTCLAVLEKWIRSTTLSWKLAVRRDDIRQILSIGLAANPTAVATATKIISLLFRDHGIDLRDLLRGGTL
ncbi:hypothetical protein ACIA5G_39490 [Amycolatopsis sp. NPDC051758]|uniref:hypothetical protein n=1 Tax=Amycolatopsis sp. NPDC051758 TaxID=3363935 RepID=UPI00379ADABC